MWKKILLISILCLSLSACSSEPETIEGYWMAENGETISFNSDKKAIIDGITYNYSIYNENNLSISLLGFAEEYRFDLDSNTLTLNNLGDNSIVVFYRDGDKQAQIQENLSQIAAEQVERERVQQELEQEQKAQKEYEKYINSLKSQIETIDSSIEETQAWIVEVQSWIADIDSDIEEVQQTDDMLADAQIENLRDEQNRLYDDIAEFQQEISNLQNEKERIIKTLKDLGEY